MLLIINN